MEALAELGVVEKVEGKGAEGERFLLRLDTEGVLGRIFGGEMGEPPKGSGLLPWFSCAFLNTVLDKKGVRVSKDEFTGMAAVIAGFMTEARPALGMRSGEERPVISHRPAKPKRR
jgi:hypothetical protein